MKKLLSLVLALVLVMSLSVTAFAAESPSVHGPENDTYTQTTDDIDVTAEYEKPADVVKHVYYVTVSWSQTGTLKYTDDEDTYTWNPSSLVYDKTVSAAGDWTCTDAKIAITVENKSDMPIKADCSASAASGLTITGGFDTSTLNLSTAATGGLIAGGTAQSDTATYSITDVDGAIAAAGTIATITVTVNAAS